MHMMPLWLMTIHQKWCLQHILELTALPGHCNLQAAGSLPQGMYV
jgi:hypothetical protein